jgi:catechol-2,3-dioxygenase
MPDNPPIIASTRIGHVHLKVADLDRALSFYCGVLGFELMQRIGSGAAFISAGGYHHHIGLNTGESKGGHPPPRGTTGLFNTAILYPTRPALPTRSTCEGRHSARRRQRSRRQRGALFTRSRRERRRALLGPPQGIMAART